MNEPDRELLERFVNGNRDAFEALFRHYEREVYRWTMRIVREAGAAEDAVVESFWRAYRGRARFDPSRSFGAWMRRIATRVAIDQLNARRRRRWILFTDVGRVPPRIETLGGAPASIARTGYTDTTDFELTGQIRSAFAGLPPKLRVVATLALIEECPLGEIADALDVPLGTVKSRLFRATRLLRDELSRLGVHT